MPGESSSPPPEYKLPFRRGWKLIELGGGETPSIRPNADSRWLNTVDIVCDFNYPLPIPSQSYDGVFAKFVFEHLSWRKVDLLPKEVHRILRPGGIAVFVMANLYEQCKAAIQRLDAGEGWQAVSEFIFGSQEFGIEWRAGAHHCGFSPQEAEKLFKEAGFWKVEVKPWPASSTDMVLEATKSAAVIV